MYHKYIYLLIFVLSLLLSSCQKFEIVRVMDTVTDSVELSSSRIIVYGAILDVGEKKIIQHGHCWSSKSEPTVNDFKTELGEVNERDTFVSELNRIIPGLNQYVRSYIYDGTDYVYGNTLEFKITADDIEFDTYEPEIIDVSSLLVKTKVGNIGSLNFDTYGHCWSQTYPPTIDDGHSTYGGLDTAVLYSSKISNLNMGKYYIRAYLESEGGVIYSDSVVFESKINVETGIYSDLSQTNVTVYGLINSLGVEPIIDYGHCWSIETSYPTLNNSHNSLGATDKLGAYSSNIENLLPGATYYVRAYATDGIHVFYGDVISFTPN